MIKLLIGLFFILGVTNSNAEKIILTEDNSITFNQAFTSLYVAQKQLEVMVKSAKLPKNKPLFIVMDTPGGSVPAGLNFIDTVNSLDRKVHTITIFAASMGYQTVQELGTRYITRSGILMSHRGSLSGLSGQVPGEINTRLSHIERILDDMNKRAAKRTGMSLKNYKDAIQNELWLSGEEAVAQNHADKIANVSCDQKLIKGTTETQLNTIFGPVSLKFSKCPLISEPVEVKFGNIKDPTQKSAVLRLVNERRTRRTKADLTL